MRNKIALSGSRLRIGAEPSEKLRACGTLAGGTPALPVEKLLEVNDEGASLSESELDALLGADAGSKGVFDLGHLGN